MMVVIPGRWFEKKHPFQRIAWKLYDNDNRDNTEFVSELVADLETIEEHINELTKQER